MSDGLRIRGRLQGGILFFAACLFLSLAGCKGKGDVFIHKDRKGHYRLIAAGAPFVVRGVCYSPVPVGKNHEYDFFSDPNKPWKKDAELMKAAGINTVRFYQPGPHAEVVKELISGLYNDHGIYTIMGSWAGFWEYPLGYADAEFRGRIKKQVLEMVNTYKDTPGILMWVLGNENNYSFNGQVNPWSSPEIDAIPDLWQRQLERARIYYSFINEIAREIKQVDPDHPVALGNGELKYLEVASAGICPDIDLIACVIYRGKTFGNLFDSLKFTFDKPVIISEFGADAYNAKLKEEDEGMQAFFLESQWRQIYENLAGGPKGAGNCVGGVMFEWNDEWWKHNEYDLQGWPAHDTGSNWSKGEYYFDIEVPGGMNMNEEWFGIVALSEESDSGLNKRVPRKSYYVLKKFFQDPDQEWITEKERKR
ncbi:MAG: glycoside hydrolase family 2 TIM barrel-domain containing protein [Candidatus Omnitrophica bacterium]|nr:glycoside hydrolase family 2 TIM barrel-domain containing protein [Candidatus Omnitrophota bacterium]